jgi:hypothetical protein
MSAVMQRELGEGRRISLLLCLRARARRAHHGNLSTLQRFSTWDREGCLRNLTNGDCRSNADVLPALSILADGGKEFTRAA